MLDTWFSSWLWPFSVFGWPEETDDLDAFYPTHDMVTAPEIIFFWVARMIMAGYEFMGEAPFTQVYLHGTVRDMKGRKMSKSLGNGIDPIEVVDRFGADALRFTLLSSGWGRNRHPARSRRPGGVVRTGPKLCQQALERRPLRSDDPWATIRCPPCPT